MCLAILQAESNPIANKKSPPIARQRNTSTYRQYNKIENALPDNYTFTVEVVKNFTLKGAGAKTICYAKSTD